MDIPNALLDFSPEPTPLSSVRVLATPRRLARLAEATRRSIHLTSFLAIFGGGFAAGVCVIWLVDTPLPESIVRPEREASRSAPARLHPTASTPIVAPTPVAAAIAPRPATAAIASKPFTPRPAAVVKSVTPSPLVSPSSPVPFRGTLAVSSEPEGAQVLLNGALVGTTPLVLDQLSAGSRAVLVRQTGYQPWSSSIRVVANARTSVHAHMVASAAVPF